MPETLIDRVVRLIAGGKKPVDDANIQRHIQRSVALGMQAAGQIVESQRPKPAKIVYGAPSPHVIGGEEP